MLEKKELVDAKGTSGQPATATAQKPPSVITRLASIFPPWVTENLRSRNSWKLFARCWLASWVSFIIILPHRSLLSLGNAAFLAFIASLMLPPNMPVQLFVFAMATVLIGMLLGWGIGAAAMRAALAARDQVLLKQSLLTAQQSAAGAANPDAEFQLELFRGAFLDTRSTAVYGSFLGVSSFLFALIRAYAPKLSMMSIFGTIVADVYCSYGPLFPVGQYTLVNTLLISVSSYMAIAIFCIIFIFPETMNHSFLAAVSTMLGDARSFLDLHGRVLDMDTKDLHAGRTELLQNGKSLHAKLVAGLEDLKSKSTFVNGEFSWGRWNGNDLKTLNDPLRQLVARIHGFQGFVRLLDPHRIALVSGSIPPSETSSSTSSSNEPSVDTELIRQLLSRHQDLEERYNVRVTDVLPIVKDSTADLRSACAEALAAAKSLIDEINTRRWKRGTSRVSDEEDKLQEAIDRLRSELNTFKATSRYDILNPFMPILQSLSSAPEHQRRRGVPIRSLTITSVYVAHVIASSDSLVNLTELVLTTSRKRQKCRVWAPSGLRALGKALFKREGGNALDQPLGDDRPIKEDEEEVKEERMYRRDPDSRPPTNVVQRVMNAIHAVYKWSRTPEALFCIKYVVVTIALWIPSVIRSTAFFMYVEKSVWALIMAQTTLNIYAADQIYNYVARIIGTFLGLVAGLVAWYIGNAHGNGNPFGSAAVVAVLLVPAVFVRVFAPLSQIVPMVMFSVTFALIVGYSWIDGHLITIGNPGIGWDVAWKRFVLVMVGSAASFILMFLPPTSGRKAVRIRNAMIITELSHLYAFLISSWISLSTEDPKTDASSPNTDGNGSGKPETRPAPDWLNEYRVRLLSIATQIQELRGQTAIAKWEGNIRGKWPNEEYESLLEKSWDMLTALAQLGGALIHLDPLRKKGLDQRARVLNPNFFTDVMTTFALISQSLRTGEPMHEVVPAPLLDRLLYHQQYQHFNQHRPSTLEPSMIRSKETEKDQEEMDLVQRVQSLEFVFFATGVAAVSQIITCLDDMHRTVKTLCGEVPFKGYEGWKNEFDRVYSRA